MQWSMRQTQHCWAVVVLMVQFIELPEISYLKNVRLLVGVILGRVNFEINLLLPYNKENPCYLEAVKQYLANPNCCYFTTSRPKCCNFISSFNSGMAPF